MSKSIATGVALTAAALLAVPSGAIAKPNHGDRVNAAQECRAERGGTDATREAFQAKYGTNANKRNAFGKCVSTRARDEEREGRVARANASKECKAEAEEIGLVAFREKYGSGKQGRNAHGKCVSGKAKQHEAEADAEDLQVIRERKSAAKACAAERDETGAEAFREKYGTSKSKRNAFGKCVSQTAKAKHEENEEETAPAS
jgi:hypothetical protein